MNMDIRLPLLQPFQDLLDRLRRGDEEAWSRVAFAAGERDENGAWSDPNYADRYGVLLRLREAARTGGGLPPSDNALVRRLLAEETAAREQNPLKE